jgi:hypothetical protein
LIAAGLKLLSFVGFKSWKPLRKQGGAVSTSHSKYCTCIITLIYTTSVEVFV